MSKALNKKQLDDYKQLCIDRMNGRLLTPERLRMICEANNYDPKAIGQHFLDLLPKICPPDRASTDLSDDEVVELIASQILEEHKAAFEELAK